MGLYRDQGGVGYTQDEIAAIVSGALEDALEEMDSYSTGILGLGPKARARRAVRQTQRETAQTARRAVRQAIKDSPGLQRLAAATAKQQGVQRILEAQETYAVNAAKAAFGGPAALIETDDGGSIVAPAGEVPQGKVYPLSFTVIGGVGSLVGVPIPDQLSVRAERGFQPTRLILETSITGSGLVLVTDIDVGTGRQVANLEPMPAGIFAVNATFARVAFDVIRSGTLARIGLLFIPGANDSSATVSGAYYGIEL